MYVCFTYLPSGCMFVLVTVNLNIKYLRISIQLNFSKTQHRAKIPALKVLKCKQQEK